jgi:hypothetical protein
MARARSVEWIVAGGVGVALGVFAACGADDVVAPAAESQGDIQKCRSFDELMPNFVNALNTGQTANLKAVIENPENHLTVGVREDVPPPINDVLRSIFMTLTRLAQKPPEPGAINGQYCAPAGSPPPLNQSNEVCEMRRSLDILVHQGKGIDAVNLIRPQLLGILNYISGKSKDGKPHYEITAVFSGACSQDANCQLSNGLDLVIAFSDYAQTTQGKKLFDDLNALVAKPSVNQFLDPTKFQEDDFVNIMKFLIPVLQTADPAQLDALFNGNQLPIPQNLKDDLKPVITDLEDVLGHKELTDPMKASLQCIWGESPPAGSGTTCWSGKDGCNFDLLRMMYRLAIRDALPEFGLTKLMAVLQGLQKVDSRGSLVYLAGTLARAVRSDEQAIDSAAAVCKTLLSNNPVPNQARPNAQMVTPVLATLVEDHVIEEGICTIDTLLFGCAGGTQPACPPGQ